MSGLDPAVGQGNFRRVKRRKKKKKKDGRAPLLDRRMPLTAGRKWA
jgi:hypothetical protein